MKNGIGLSSNITMIAGVPTVLLTYRNDEVIHNSGWEIDFTQKFRQLCQKTFDFIIVFIFSKITHFLG